MRKKSTGVALFSGEPSLWLGLVGQVEGVLSLVGVIMRMVMTVTVTVIMTVRMVVAVFMSVLMTMAVRVWPLVIMPVHLAVFMGMPFTRIRLAMGARVFVEDKRFDGDGHGPGWHANAAKIDKVKAPQRDAINDQDFALHALVFFEKMS